MNLEELQDELNKDIIIDHTKLQYEAANNPVLYTRWLNKYSNIRKEMLRLDATRKRDKKGKLDYYTGRGDEVCLDRYERSEMKTVLEGDKDLLNIETKLLYLGILLDFCSSAMDAIKSRGFSIKHIQDMRQFESGQ